MSDVLEDYVDGESRGYAIASEGSFNVTNFLPQGPVGAAFVADRESLVRGIMGPWGSGKTNLAFYDAFQWAVTSPVCTDGVRRFMGTIVRDTYRNLETTIKSWQAWAPRTKGEWSGGAGDRPARHALEFDLMDGTMLSTIFEFKAIGDQKVEEALLGFESNWLFGNELTTLPPDIITYGVGRLGRYPSAKLLGDDQARIAQRVRRMVVDYNAPEVGHWVYKLAEEERPEGMRFYKQPGGRSPNAENMRNLPPGYYPTQYAMHAHKPWFIRRFLDNEYGFSRAGRPVFGEEYVDELNCPGVLPPIDAPVWIGLDGGMGLHPAAVIVQWTPDGQVILVGSLYLGRCGSRRFAQALKAMLDSKFPSLPIGGMWCDPTAWRGYEAEFGEIGFIEILQGIIGKMIQPAFTNQLGIRLDAVRKALTYPASNARRILQVSSSEFDMRKGFNSDYMFAVDKKDDSKLSDDPEPVKGDISHRMDALQYVLCGMLGEQFVLRDKLVVPRYVPPAGMGRRPIAAGHTARTDFNV